MQSVNSEFSFFKSPIGYESAKAIQLMCTSHQRYELPFKQSIWACLITLTDNTPLTEVLTELNGGYLFNSLNSEIFVEFEFAFVKELFNVKFGSFIKLIIQKLSFFLFIKYFSNRTI